MASAQATPDDLAAQAQALRQIIAQMELEAAELEPQVEAARTELSELTARIEAATRAMMATKDSISMAP